MRLLKVRVDGVELFRNQRLEIDFVATDRVPKDEEGNIADVTRLPKGASLYTQNVMGIVGVNASGKTTALNVVRFVLGYMSGTYAIRRFVTSSDRLGKLGDTFSVACVFYEEGKFYLIESRLRRVDDDLGSSRLRDASVAESYVFDDEWLWSCSLPPIRVTRGLVTDIEAFKQASELVLVRNGSPDDERALDQRRRTFLGDSMSIVSIVTGRKSIPLEFPDRVLPLISMPTPVLQAFDPSIEYLNWNVENQVFHLKFKNETGERVVSDSVAASILSNGTILGAELVDRAISALKSGGYLIVDEIETGLNRSLVGTVIGLFASPVTNPRGATLLFSTHYSELLDALQRKDNVYVLVRDDAFKTEVVKYSDRIERIENKKSDVIINNVIKGSMPKYPDVQAMRNYVCEHVNG